MPSVHDTFDREYPRVVNVGADTPDETGVVIKSNDIIGIEVEVENITRVGLMRSCWQSAQDGSLRNNGVEFISRPMQANRAPAALYSLMNETLPQDKCFSPRTSVHVHLDYTRDQLATVVDTVLVYAVFERLFYRFVGRNRIRNIYCVPLTETYLLWMLGYNGMRPDMWQKYTGLNLKPLAEHGTIEFRHMHGTPDARKLAIWVDIITRLKAFVVAQGSKSIRSLIAAMDDGFAYDKLLVDIFGERAADLGYTGVEDVSFCAKAAKQVVISKNHFTNLRGSVAGEAPYFKVRKV